jgi:phosphoglycolate phosphatase
MMPNSTVKKKKLILFDLDGVLIDSRCNMKLAWDKVCNKFQINIPFDEYFAHIGRPFSEILTLLRIFENKKQIETVFIKESFHSLEDIPIYEGVNSLLIKLQQKKIKIGVVTSKEKARTKIILNKLDVEFSVIKTPDDICRGKPAPDHLLMAMALLNVDPIDTLFVGDMLVDYLAAQRAGIDYVHANWGYGACDDSNILHIDKISELTEFV